MTGRTARSTFAAAAVCWAVCAGAAGRDDIANPWSPRHGHPYRRGAVPTADAARRMRAWTQLHAPSATTFDLTLSYAGGSDGVGVGSGVPKVYLVVYGNQWGAAAQDADGNLTLANDSAGSVPFLQRLFRGIGTGGELWSGIVTQYCDGPSVAAMAVSCPIDAHHIGYPDGGAFAGIWYDNAAPSPMQATGAQLAAEAVAAAGHFGNVTASSNRAAQYVVLSPPGTNPDGFNLPASGFCAWHDFNSDPQLSGGAVASLYGDIAFTNLPYMPDAGAPCGANAVNAGAAGALDGVSLTAGHEYAETLTDPLGTGWYNQTGDVVFNDYELADECDGSFYGSNQNVVLGSGTFPLQTLWSNDTDACEIAHPIVRDDEVFGSGFE